MKRIVMSVVALLSLVSITLAQQDAVDRTKPITISNGVVEFTAWEGTLMRIAITNAIELGVVSNGWNGYFTNATPSVSVVDESILQQAAIFKFTLNKNFGSGAITNRAVTAAVVSSYFMGKQLNGTITVQELADAIVLDKLFTILSTWTGTGETWTFPWDLVPEM